MEYNQAKNYKLKQHDIDQSFVELFKVHEGAMNYNDIMIIIDFNDKEKIGIYNKKFVVSFWDYSEEEIRIEYRDNIEDVMDLVKDYFVLDKSFDLPVIFKRISNNKEKEIIIYRHEINTQEKVRSLYENEEEPDVITYNDDDDENNEALFCLYEEIKEMCINAMDYNELIKVPLSNYKYEIIDNDILMTIREESFSKSFNRLLREDENYNLKKMQRQISNMNYNVFTRRMLYEEIAKKYILVNENKLASYNNFKENEINYAVAIIEETFNNNIVLTKEINSLLVHFDKKELIGFSINEWLVYSLLKKNSDKFDLKLHVNDKEILVPIISLKGNMDEETTTGEIEDLLDEEIF